MSDANPYSPPSSSLEVKPTSAVVVQVSPGEPVGIGGWLVLVCIGLTLLPIRLGLTLVQTYAPVLSDGTWESLVDSASAGYHPLLAALMVVELVVNCVFMVFSIWLLILFFRRSRRFPKQAVLLYAASAIFVVGDTAALSAMGFEVIDPDSMREVMRALFSAAIWIPYMFVSRRVKNTFVQE